MHHTRVITRACTSIDTSKLANANVSLKHTHAHGQVDEPQNPFGLDQAWRWLARFLNALPASRATAKALICFLRPAGYSMHQR